MTPYTFECPTHGAFEDFFTMGEAPREAACPDCFTFSPRVFGAVIKFTYGKQDFHGPTIGERHEQHMKECAAAGIKAEPVGTRWV